jgi:hypothetical protein
MQGSSGYSEKRQGFRPEEKEEIDIQSPQRQLPEHVQTICSLISKMLTKTFLSKSKTKWTDGCGRGWTAH